MTEEIDIETLTALIRKEVRTAFREAGEMLLKAILSGVREDIPPHEKRVITVVQREPIQYKNALRDDGGDLRGTELSLNKSYVSMMKDDGRDLSTRGTERTNQYKNYPATGE